MFLIDNILLAPLKGVIWIASKINEAAQQEVSDGGKIKEEMMQLQLRFELDEISEEEYDKQEAELLARLDAATKANRGET